MNTIFAVLLQLNTLSASATPDAITRQLGLELLRQRMIEHRIQELKSINRTPPGYFLIGYPVRVA